MARKGKRRCDQSPVLHPDSAGIDKLARIIFHLLNTRESYNESVFHKCEEEILKRAELRLRKHAAQLGFQIVPAVNA